MSEVNRKVGLVASRFNGEYTDALLQAAQQGLDGFELVEARVPGSFEIPLAVQRMIREEKPMAVIALGVIWQGKTAHADLIAETVTQALMDIMLREDVPVIHQVLQVANTADARERCLGTEINRGSEAAEAVRMLAGLPAEGGNHG